MPKTSDGFIGYSQREQGTADQKRSGVQYEKQHSTLTAEGAQGVPTRSSESRNRFFTTMAPRHRGKQSRLPLAHATRLSSTLRLRPEGSLPKSSGKETATPFGLVSRRYAWSYRSSRFAYHSRMKPASRTPEGQPNHCPVCGKPVRIEPSQPTCDAPCPWCGHLLWFDPPGAIGAEVIDRRAPELPSFIVPGAKVRIGEGTFESFDGVVSSLDKSNGEVSVLIEVFGRATPVELEYWQLAAE
jgi:hypothetical protein